MPAVPFGTAAPLLDRFTGAPGDLIAAHVPDAGGAYTYLDGGAGAIKLDGVGGVFGDGAISNTWKLAHQPAMPQADYGVQAEIQCLSQIATQEIGIGARITDLTHWYALTYIEDGTSSRIRLSNWNGGAFNVGMKSYSHRLTTGESMLLTLALSGTLLTAYINGLRVTDVTSALIAGPGSAGIITNNLAAGTAGTGLHLRQLTAWY